MKKRSFPVTNIGSASLLMTFIVLCMVVFSVLSLSGALNEYQYTQKMAAQNTAYFEASNAATRIIAHMDAACADIASDTSSEAYYPMLRSQFTEDLSHITDLPDIQLTFEDDFDSPEGSHRLSFILPVNENQHLFVSLRFTDPQDLSSAYYEILTWQKIAATDWHSDNSINLLH